jgi:hypothetical protein
MLYCGRFEERGKIAAWRAPRCPEIDEDERIVFYRRVERVSGEFDGGPWVSSEVLSFRGIRGRGRMLADSRAGRRATSLPYIGRFAPSPTGPLHKGSLVAALASWLDARAHGGQWLLRIEDVDEPRCSKAAADTILHQLDALGLHWDGELLWQSLRTSQYRAALKRLIDDDFAFACDCSRRDLEDQPLSLDGTRRYPGTCRDRVDVVPRAWRFRVPPGDVTFDDLLCGPLSIDVARDVGDFVLWLSGTVS